MQPCLYTPNRYRSTALIVWAIFLVVIAVLVNLPGKQGMIYPTYVDAGHHIRTGESLYSLHRPIPEGRDLFRYSPAAAVLLIPWEFIPSSIGSVLWRWGQVLALLLAMRAWCKIATPPVDWYLVILLALPICGGNVHNGQLNTLVAALLIASLVAFQGERFWLAGLAIALATAIKGYPLAMGLLLCVIDFRRFVLPLLVSLAALALMPFAVQDYQYVFQQYSDWIQLVTGDDRSKYALDVGYFNLQRLLLRWGLEITSKQYLALEMFAGLSAALFVLAGIWKLKWQRSQAIQVAGWMGFLWMTLFGPTTESATYILLAMPIAHACLTVFQRPLLDRLLVWTCYILMLSNVVINWLPSATANELRTLMPQPHGAVLLMIWMVLESLRFGRDESVKQTVPSPPCPHLQS